VAGRSSSRPRARRPPAEGIREFLDRSEPPGPASRLPQDPEGPPGERRARGRRAALRRAPLRWASDSGRTPCACTLRIGASTCACSRPSGSLVAARGNRESAPTSTRLMQLGTSAYALASVRQMTAFDYERQAPSAAGRRVPTSAGSKATVSVATTINALWNASDHLAPVGRAGRRQTWSRSRCESQPQLAADFRHCQS
jgi:hypothetical protein